jgi:hypothetical protein
MLVSHHQKESKNHTIKIAKRSSESMAKLKYLGMTVRDQNLIHEEIKRDEIWVILATI